MRWALLALLVIAVFGFGVLPGLVDRSLNRVGGVDLPPATEAARRLLASAAVVDLHADPLLWDRDLLERAGHGQVDLPRLLEGGVAVQVFGLVTQSPVRQNFERTPADDPDAITLLAVLQRWPLATWTQRSARALHQAGRLAAAAEASDGRLVLLRSRSDLEGVLTERSQGRPQVGGLLGLEGMHALDGDLANLDRLFEAGVRMMAPTHFFDNRIGGSSAGEEKGGLTPLGGRALERMGALGVIPDVAHASPDTLADVLRVARGPVVASHTGVQATCPGPRNLSDDQVRAIAATGGVIGVGYFAGAVCDITPAAIARAMAHVRRVAGAEHVALGSDFDGAVRTAFDTTGLALVVDALLAEGFTPEEIQLALGTNALRVLRATLPKD